jgi:REP element-mobilizing transposase RayT
MGIDLPISARETIRRCPGWDYASPGAYFVTVCTQHHRCYFGEVSGGKMVLNKNGQIAELYWKDIPSHHSHVVLDAFVIMPNHVHGIVVITDFINPGIESVATLHATSLRNDCGSESEYFSAISPKKGSLSTITRSYESAVTKTIHRDLNPGFAWQPRFYDHIIRGDHDLDNLRWYISLNPENWRQDEQPVLAEAAIHA